jgi:hypothetical protein
MYGFEHLDPRRLSIGWSSGAWSLLLFCSGEIGGFVLDFLKFLVAGCGGTGQLVLGWIVLHLSEFFLSLVLFCKFVSSLMMILIVGTELMECVAWGVLRRYTMAAGVGG